MSLEGKPKRRRPDHVEQAIVDGNTPKLRAFGKKGAGVANARKAMRKDAHQQRLLEARLRSEKKAQEDWDAANYGVIRFPSATGD